MTKASSVGDVLAVQAQLDNLQSQIEQLQGQLAVLQSETDYSTLTVAVSEEPPAITATSRQPAASGIAKAWQDSLHGFAVGVDGIIRLAGPVVLRPSVLGCLGPRWSAHLAPAAAPQSLRSISTVTATATPAATPAVCRASSPLRNCRSGPTSSLTAAGSAGRDEQRIESGPRQCRRTQ